MTASTTTMPRGYTFKTHQTLYSSATPKFESFTRLSASGAVERWLACAGAEIVFTTEGSRSRRDVHRGSIVLCERHRNLWVLQIPTNQPWTQAYSGDATEKNVDDATDRMLARDLAKSTVRITNKHA